ncbi:MAG TPA: HdeD family acid-resistance protein [Verrucomicrobiae bacterium]|jgi:uncharacterized membrane protein HdeD (DUF308 family)|nr:HdeD family acid-resistance protein [Verrucomicrobiae bacterium]
MAEAVLKRASSWSIVLGILMIIAGIVAMVEPGISGLFITIVVGWSAIFNGVAQIIFGVRTHGGWHVLLEVLLGIIYIIAGIYLLMHPVGGLLALTLILASFLLVYGIFAVVLAFQIKPRGGWGWVLFDGIVTLLLGVLIWAHWPFNSDWVVGTLFGISIFMSGVTRLMMSIALRKVASAS